MDATPDYIGGLSLDEDEPILPSFGATVSPALRKSVGRQAAQAMKLVAERNRVIVEGAAACAIAAAGSGRAGSGKIVAIISGGNIDLDKFAQVVARA
jgi:hypothetical protein